MDNFVTDVYKSGHAVHFTFQDETIYTVYLDEYKPDIESVEAKVLTLAEKVEIHDLYFQGHIEREEVHALYTKLKHNDPNVRMLAEKLISRYE
jgi:hypothetical protein